MRIKRLLAILLALVMVISITTNSNNIIPIVHAEENDTIEYINSRFMKGATYNEDTGTYDYRTNNPKNTDFIFRVSYALSRADEFTPGEVLFKVPLHYFYDDTYDASSLVNSNFGVSDVDDDYIYITNINTLDPAVNGYFEIKYTITRAQLLEHPGSTNTTFVSDVSIIAPTVGSATDGTALETKTSNTLNGIVSTYVGGYINKQDPWNGKSGYKSQDGILDGYPRGFDDCADNWSLAQWIEDNEVPEMVYLYYPLWITVDGGGLTYNMTLTESPDTAGCIPLGYCLNNTYYHGDWNDNDDLVLTLHDLTNTGMRVKSDGEYVGTYIVYALVGYDKATFDAETANEQVKTFENSIQLDLDHYGVIETSNSHNTYAYQTRESIEPTKGYSLWDYGKYPGKSAEYVANAKNTANSTNITSTALSRFVGNNDKKLSFLPFYVQAIEDMDLVADSGSRHTLETDMKDLTIAAINGDPYTLTKDDFQLDQIRIEYHAFLRNYSVTTGKPSGSDRIIGIKSGTIELYGYVNTYDNPVLMLTIDASDGSYTLSQDALDLGADYTTSVLTFNYPNNNKVIGYKLTTDMDFDAGSLSDFYAGAGQYVNIYPIFSINRNTNTLAVATEANNDETKLMYFRNEASANWDSSLPNQSEVTRSNHAMDYIKGYTKSKTFNKQYSKIYKDETNNSVKVDWTAEVNEYITNSNQREYIQQSYGIFYDILPVGSHLISKYNDDPTLPLKDMIYVYDDQSDGLYNNVFKQITDYTVTLVKNGKINANGQNQDVIIIRINEPFYSAYLSYTTETSLSDIGTDTYKPDNYLAYETGNGSIMDGCTASSVSSPLRQVCQDYGEMPNSMRFLSCHRQATISGLTYEAQDGLSKQVKGESSTYKSSDYVYNNGAYSYKIKYSLDDNTRASDMVFFDTLEQANGSEFTGTLTSVGFTYTLYDSTGSTISLAYNQDRTYYSTQVLDVSDPDNQDLSDTSKWTAERHYSGDMADVKTIAVDFTYTNARAKNKLLEAYPGSYINLFVYMKAPETADSTDIIAHNDVYLSSTITNVATDESMEVFTSQGSTTLHRYTSTDLNILKVDSETNEPLSSGVSFRLYGTADNGTEVNVYRGIDQHGIATFNNIATGTYSLTESYVNDNYFKSDNIYTVHVNDDGTITIDNMANYPELLSFEDNTLTISNTPRLHYDVEFYKKNQSNNSMLDNIRFILTGTSIYGTEVETTANSYSGQVWFGNLEPGNYVIEEDYNPNYYCPYNELHLTLNQDGTYTIDELDMELIDDESKYVLYNVPYTDFTIRKMDKYSNIALANATFNLVGTNVYGEAIDITRKTNTNGYAGFYTLLPGTYTLTETIPPEGYDVLTTPINVIINAQSQVIIEELDYDTSSQSFIVPNVLTAKNVVEITKIWSDNGKEDLRSFPKIHLNSTITSNSTLTNATIDKAKWTPIVNQTSSEYGQYGVYYISSLARTRGLSETEVLTKTGVRRIDDETSDFKIYCYPDLDNVVTSGPPAAPLVFWSDADIIKLPEDSSNLFNGAAALQSIDGSIFDTSDVTNMSYMFTNCGGVFNNSGTTMDIDISSWDTSKVTNMSYMFSNDSRDKVNIIGLTHMNTSNVTNMSYMFAGAKPATGLDLSHFDMSNVTDITSMLKLGNSGSSTIDYINISNWKLNQFTDVDDISADTVIGGAFYALYMNDWKLNSITSLDSLLDRDDPIGTNCYLVEINRLYAPVATSAENALKTMHGYADHYGEIYANDWYVPNVTSINQLFGMSGSSYIENISLRNWQIESLETASFVFCNMPSLQTIDLTGWYCPNIKDTSHMFQYLTNNGLNPIDLSGFSTANITDANQMFCVLPYVSTIYVGDDWENLDAFDPVFISTISLVGGQGTAFQVESSTSGTFAKVDGGTDSPGYFTYKQWEEPERVDYSAVGNAIPVEDDVETGTPIDYVSNDIMYDGDNPEEVYDQWIDNGDGTWTYRFTVLKYSAKFTAYEDAMNSYISDTPIESKVKFTMTQDGTLNSDDDRIYENKVHITNATPLRLPNTGGRGVILFTVLGALVILLGLFMLKKKNDK